MTRVPTLMLALACCAEVVCAAEAQAPKPAASEPASAYFLKRLVGKFDGQHPFTMNPENVDGELSGSYRYDRWRQDLYLHGSIDAQGRLVMQETSAAKVSGSFTGQLVGGRMAGTWTSADGLRHMPFVAEQASEVHVGPKREILAEAVGDFPLTTISGSGGANGMWDTWLLNGLHVTVDADLTWRLMVQGEVF